MGSKRNEITEEQINEIVRLYGDAQPNECVKIFDNEDFGYTKITVERPLRLNFQVNEERLAHVVEGKGFANLATSNKKVMQVILKSKKAKAANTNFIYFTHVSK